MTFLDRETLRRGYERSAPTYDERFRVLQREKYTVMLGAEAALGHGPWLDLGCGTGLLHTFLMERGRDAATLVGVDFARAMLTRAQQRGLPTVQSGIDVLPFRDNAFGAVFAFTALRIVPDAAAEQRTLAEVARVLERGGTFVLTVLQVGDDPTLRERLASAGFRADAGRACGQDVGYRCVRA